MTQGPIFWPIVQRKEIRGTDREEIKILDAHIINICEIISRNLGSWISFANKGPYVVKPLATLHKASCLREPIWCCQWNTTRPGMQVKPVNLPEWTICPFFSILGTRGIAIFSLFYKAIKKGLVWTCIVMRGLCQAAEWFTWATLTTVLNLTGNSSLNTGHKQVSGFVFK